jgi:hypothetical protein
LVVGVLVIAYGHTGSSAMGPSQIAVSPYGTETRLVSSANQPASPAYSDAAAGPVLVRCEPGQQAMVRDVRGVNGEAVRQIECVGAAPAVYVDQYGRAVATPDGAVVTSAAYAPPRIVRTASYEPAPVARRATYQRAPERVGRSGRSWKKSALVIGGSAGTGAGIGAIAGGKKGALIGAALGGGVATLYEAMKK